MSNASDQDHAAVPSAPDERSSSASTDTAARDAARKARAIAYLQEKPKAGRPWTSKKYDYREEDDDTTRTTQKPT